MMRMDQSCDNWVIGNTPDIYCRITGQGGYPTITEIKPSKDSYFERTYNDKSTSSVSVYTPSISEECCNALGNIAIMKHELEWWRNGVLAWAGPITSIKWEKDSVSIDADDTSVWWSLRKLGSYKAHKDPSQIFLDLYKMTMDEDPVKGITVHTSPVGRTMNITVFEKERTSLSDMLGDITSGGVDYTVIGRNVLVGDADNFVQAKSMRGSIPFKLSDNDMDQSPSISSVGPGNGFMTRIYAVGKNERTVIVSASRETIMRYGLIEQVVQFPRLSATPDLLNAAKSYLLRHSNPYAINQPHTTTLKNECPLPFEVLIPGLRMLMESTVTCKRFRTEMRLSSVKGYANGKIEVSLEPVGQLVDEEITAKAIEGNNG